MKFLKVYFSFKWNNVLVQLDVRALREVVGDRVGEVVPEVLRLVREKCFYSFGLGDVKVVDKGGKITVFSLRSDAEDYGVVARAAYFLERELLKRFTGELYHVVSCFLSKSVLPELCIAVYKVDFEEGLDRRERYRILSLICKSLYREFDILSGRIGSFRVGCLVLGGGDAQKEFLVNVEGYGWMHLTFERISSVELGNSFAVDFLKRLVSREIREKLRGKFYVSGREVFEKRSIIESEVVSVLPGFEFSVDFLFDGHLALYIHPRHRVVAKKSVWDMYGRDRLEVLRNEVKLVGRRVHQVPYGETAVIAGIRSDMYPYSRVDKLSEKTVLQYVLDFFPDVCEIVSEGEPVFELVRGVNRMFSFPSLLKIIYRLEDLKAMGLSREAQRLMQIPAKDVISLSKKYLDVVSPVSLGFLDVEFDRKPLEVEFG